VVQLHVSMLGCQLSDKMAFYIGTWHVVVVSVVKVQMRQSDSCCIMADVSQTIWEEQHEMSAQYY